MLRRTSASTSLGVTWATPSRMACSTTFTPHHLGNLAQILHQRQQGSAGMGEVAHLGNRPGRGGDHAVGHQAGAGGHDAQGPARGRAMALLAWGMAWVTLLWVTAGKGAPVATRARPSVHWIKSAGLASCNSVGLERGKIMGRSQWPAMSLTMASLKLPGPGGGADEDGGLHLADHLVQGYAAGLVGFVAGHLGGLARVGFLEVAHAFLHALDQKPMAGQAPDAGGRLSFGQPLPASWRPVSGRRCPPRRWPAPNTTTR